MPLTEPEPEPEPVDNPFDGDGQVAQPAGATAELRDSERSAEDEGCCTLLCCTLLLAVIPTVLLAGEISSAPTCLDVGQSQRLRMHAGLPLQCCPGLTEVGPIQPGCGGGADGCGVCPGWRPMHQGFVRCIRCGDGICGLNEDWCSCRVDCPPPEPLDLSRDVDDRCDWFNCTGQQEHSNQPLRRVCLGGRCEPGCDSTRCWRCFSHDACDAADGCRWDHSNWLEYQAAGIVSAIGSESSSQPIAGACAPVSLDTKHQALNAQIAQVTGSVAAVLLLAVALCEALSSCASKADAPRPVEEQPEECGEDGDLGSEVAPVLGDGRGTDSAGGDSGAEASEAAPLSSGWRSASRPNGRHNSTLNNSCWYDQVLQIALCCNVLNLFVVLALPVFGWWGLSSSLSCLELRRAVCEIEDCLANDCSNDAPWPQIFWGCLVAAPFCLLSTAVFFHAACTGRIDSRDCTEPGGFAYSAGLDDTDSDSDGDNGLLYQHLGYGWEAGYGSGWDPAPGTSVEHRGLSYGDRRAHAGRERGLGQSDLARGEEGDEEDSV